MARKAQPESDDSAKLAMRKRAKREDAAGFKRVTIALSPEAVELVDGFMAAREFTSRQAALNAILERIGSDMFMRQEFRP